MFSLERKIGVGINPEDENFTTSSFEVTFAMQNCSLLNQFGGQINSGILDGDSNYRDQWRVKLSYRGNGLFQAALQLVQSDSKEEMSATFQMSLLNQSKLVELSGNSNNGTFVPGGEVTLSLKWLVSYLTQPSNGCLIDGSVFFNLQISTRRPKLERPLQNPVFVTEQLKSFLINENFTDVVLTTGNGQFPASKIVLAAQSPVFCAMFNSEMRESKQSLVQIEDFSDDVIKGFLEFIYTGKTESMKENSGELLKISEKYQVLSLKGKCEQILLKNLNVENAVDILVLAHLHNSQNLKLKIIPFINKNYSQLKNSESYGRVKKEYPQIICDLYEAIQEIK